MKTQFLAVGMVAAVAAAPVMAAGPVEPQPTAPVTIAPAAPVGTDWTGFSVGAQISYGDVDTSGAADLDGDDVLYGVRAYYDFDFGQYVVGAGLQYDFTDIDLEGVSDIDAVFRAGVRAGIDLNRSWLYGTGGYAYVETDPGALDVGNSDGFFIGAGYEYMITPNITAGAEVLYHEFSDFDVDGLDADATTIGLSINYRF